MSDRFVPTPLASQRFGRYPEYRDSGVEWLGEIPVHWETTLVKRIFHVINGSTPRTSEPDYWNGRVAWVTPEDLGRATDGVVDESERTITTAGLRSCGATLVPRGSLILSTRAPIGHIAIASVELCTNQGCRSLVLRKRSPQRFGFYKLTALRHRMQALGTGSTFTELSKTNLQELTIGDPPLWEQRAIADFLDRETARNDALVAKQQGLIKLLQEKRTALVSHAVSKGLDPDVAMKDSGVEWLGEIPAHWGVQRVKTLSAMQSGESITAATIETTGRYPVFGGNGLRGYTSNFTHEGEHILIGRQGALCGNVHIARGHFWASEHAVVVSPIRPNAVEWCGALLETMNLNQYSVAAAQPGLAVDRLRDLLVPVPPVAEQHAIADFLDRETAKIDAMIAKVNEAINHLNEYRTALISAAVTGQIDVRHHGDHTVSDNPPTPQARP